MSPSPAAPVLTMVSEAVWTVRAVTRAHRAGLLSRLEAGPVDLATAVSDCALDPRRAHALLECLSAIGMATASDGRYRGAAAGIAELGRGMAEQRLFDAAADSPEGASRMYPAAVGPLAAVMAPAAARVAELVTPAGDRVLDVGCGAAPWSIAVARRDPVCAVTALDLPAVLPATRSAVEAAGLRDRFRMIAGDMLTEPVEPDFDLVLLGNVCHLLDGPTNRRLIARLRGALRPGGRIAIVDVLPGPAGGRSAALYRFGLLERTRAGDVHPAAAYRAWLADAGFTHCAVADLGQEPGLGLITAAAPEVNG